MTQAPSHPVHWWQGRLPQEHGGLLVIGVNGEDDRVLARSRIRAALRGAIALLIGVPESDVAIGSEPGRAPSVSIHGGCGKPAPGIAISHDGGLSLAAINLRGAVGIDLMRVQDIPDWQAVAHDYLGPGVAAMLAAADARLRPAALARAWTEREARLKCHGLQLAEWTQDGAAQTGACRCAALALPPGLIGTLAWR